MEPAPTIQEALGAFVSTFRQQHGLTLDDIATAARPWGVSWGPASVRNIEGGRAAITIQTLIALGLAFRSLTGRSVTLAEMLGEAPAFRLFGDRLPPVRREWLVAVFGGRPIDGGPESMLVNGLDWAAGVLQDAVVPLEGLPEWLDDLDFLEALGNVSPTLAESRAARRLGVQPFVVVLAARRLWGRSLDEEAESRATKGSPQARGNATRSLVDEIRQALGAGGPVADG